jgi:hypothetical protein
VTHDLDTHPSYLVRLPAAAPLLQAVECEKTCDFQEKIPHYLCTLEDLFSIMHSMNKPYGEGSIGMTVATEVRRQLHVLLSEMAEMDAEDLKMAGLYGLVDLFQDTRVETFEDAGLLTMNEGLVLSTPSGQEFEIVIKQRR